MNELILPALTWSASITDGSANQASMAVDAPQA